MDLSLHLCVYGSPSGRGAVQTQGWGESLRLHSAPGRPPKPLI